MYLTVSDIADRLKVSPNLVRQWINEGRLRATRPGKEYRVSEEDLQAFTSASEYVAPPLPSEVIRGKCSGGPTKYVHLRPRKS